MANYIPVNYISKPSPDFPHVEWVELYGDKILHECAIIRRDRSTGNVLFIRVADLDKIDSERLVRFLRDRSSFTQELWEVLGAHRLPNGVNALQYFHQLVKILTPSGAIINPQAGQYGVATPAGQRSASA